MNPCDDSYPYRATACLGDDPDAPGRRVVAESAGVRLVGGRWYAHVCGLPVRCRGVFHVHPHPGTPPFALSPPWSATATPDAGDGYAVVVTGWDGESWVGKDGPLDALIDNPFPRTGRSDDSGHTETVLP